MNGSPARAIGVTAMVALSFLGLSGCVSSAPKSLPVSSTAATPASSESPTPSPPPEPTLVPGGTAQENKEFFDLVNQSYFIASGNTIPEGRGVIDTLVAAGFTKADMQITADRTAIDLPVDSLIFSVRFDNECLIGQYSALGYSAIVAPQLATGSCLVGITRAIDW
ncbi:MAG: DUF6993 domain-containing protein [Rhodoglobus sp.]